MLLPESCVGVEAPWLVIAAPQNPVIRIDLRGLDSIRIGGDDDKDEHDDESLDSRYMLILSCNELDVAIYIADGPAAVERLVTEASPLIRHLDALPASATLVSVGDAGVRRDDAFLIIGSRKFRIDEVEAYALHGADLPLDRDARLQAAMAMLVVAASERS